jgi:hypothetical protein
MVAFGDSEIKYTYEYEKSNSNDCLTGVLLSSCGNSYSNFSYEQSWEEDAYVDVEDKL